MVGAPSGFRLQLPSAKWTKSANARTDNLRFQQVPTHSEDILDDTVQAEEPFSLTGRLEATHVPFPLTGRLMRGLDTIVGVPSRVVGYSTQDRSHHRDHPDAAS